MPGDVVAIQVRNLGKKYRIGGPQEKYRTFRDAIVNSIKSPLQSIGGQSESLDFWALNDISFDVRQGEVVGIIGRNGAGKSTLLKILSRITSPTEGSIDLYGRVGSLLEVGTGFHPELTGRENIFLSGAILGMKKREIEDKLDAIVKFSEIEKFLDTPAKRYSSGMYVRLAFAVAAHLDPEILLVDEVLAVGDAAFQKKCLGKMGSIANEGITVLYVSHNLTSVVKLCPQAIWLEQGRLREINDTKTIIQSYLSSGLSAMNARIEFIDTDNKPEAHISTITIKNGNDEITSDLEISSPINVVIDFYCSRNILNFRVDVVISSIDGNPLMSSTTQDYDKIDQIEAGFYSIRMTIPDHFLASGEYYLSVNLAEVNVKNFDFRESILRFRVTGSPYKHERNMGFLVYPFEWQIKKK
jgi:lipopolysaccharide transport system ATP-binding protein